MIKRFISLSEVKRVLHAARHQHERAVQLRIVDGVVALIVQRTVDVKKLADLLDGKRAFSALIIRMRLNWRRVYLRCFGGAKSRAAPSFE